jgi:hypothetical protein
MINTSYASRMTTFHVVTKKFEYIHCPQEKNLISQSTARRLKDPWVPNQFLSPKQPLKQGSQRFVDIRLLSLLGPYLQHAINKFNTCSQISTPRSLTNTDGGNNLRGVGFPQHSPHPSQPTILRFPLLTPSGLELMISTRNFQSRCVVDLQ